MTDDKKPKSTDDLSEYVKTLEAENARLKIQLDNFVFVAGQQKKKLDELEAKLEQKT